MKKAFTLAEVLITLGIIGVVVALTMPTLITKYQKRQTVAQLKSAYSILSNAVLLSINKNGPTSEWFYNNSPENASSWGNNAKNFYFTYLDEFLQVGEYCGIKHTEPRKGACKEIYAQGDTIAYSVILKNGVGLTIRGDSRTEGMEIQLDINGAKNPNRCGRDGFIFEINTNEGLTPKKNDLYGMEPCTRTLKNPNGYANWAGWGCAYVIMQNGWEIPKDYPWNDL